MPDDLTGHDRQARRLRRVGRARRIGRLGWRSAAMLCALSTSLCLGQSGDSARASEAQVEPEALSMTGAPAVRGVEPMSSDSTS